nr:FAD-binding oxidoreductase [Streptomyces sp. SID5468]
MHIAVVDAGHPGAGASGRGTGLLGPRAGPAVDVAVRRYGPATARRMYQASLRAVADVLDLCDRLGVRRGVRPGEQLVATRSPGGLIALTRQADAYRALGLDVPVLTRTALRRRLEPPYTAALLYRDAATLDPAALTRALATACAAKGVHLYGASPLREVRAGRPGGTRLVFPHGTVRTGQAVLAVGAAAAAGAPVGTVLPLQVYAIATAPLPPAARKALGGGALSVVDAMPLAPYFRLLPDGGLVAGGGTVTHLPDPDARHADRARGRAWAWLAGWVRGLHPELAGVPVTHRWAGRIGHTLDGLPVVGPVPGRPGVWYVGGCCGHGLAMSVAHGAHLAGELLGEGCPEPGGPLPWHRSRAPRLPLPAPARPLLRAALATAGRAARRNC